MRPIGWVTRLGRLGLFAGLGLLVTTALLAQQAYYVFRTQGGPTNESVQITDGSRTVRIVPNLPSANYNPIIATGDSAFIGSANVPIALVGWTNVAAGLKVFPSGGVAVNLASDPGAGLFRAPVALLDQWGSNYTVVPTTGTMNDLTPNAGVIVFSADANKVLTGLAPHSSLRTPVGRAQIVLLYNEAGTLRLAHNDTGSTAGNRFMTHSARGQMLGVGGWAMAVYDAGILGGSGGWRIVAVEPGDPIPIPYNAADFTSNTGTWTVESGDIITWTYQQVGKIVRLDFEIAFTSTSSAGAELRALLPNGFVGRRRSRNVFRAVSAGIAEAGLVGCDSGSAVLTFNRMDGSSAWPNSTNTTHIEGQITIEVQ